MRVRAWGTVARKKREGLAILLRRLRVAGLTALFALSIFPHAQTPATATSRGSGQIAGHEVTLWDPAGSGGALSLRDGADILSVDAGNTGPATLLFTSDTVA